MIIVYHGTDSESAHNILTNGIIIAEGNESTDFGQGFYTTPDKDFAIKSANRASKRTDKPPSVLEFELEDRYIEQAKLFTGATIEWAQFIVNNRCGSEYVRNVKSGSNNLNGKFGIVQGLIADGNVVEFAQSCLEEMRKVVEEDIKTIYSSTYPEQITFHNQESVKLLHHARLIKGGERRETY